MVFMTGRIISGGLVTPPLPTGAFSILKNKSGINYYVDVATGSDGNPGSASAPFKTMGRALKQLRFRYISDTVVTIFVAASGVYEDVDSFFVQQNQSAWAELRGIFLGQRSLLQIEGTGGVVDVRGDTGGDTVAVRRRGVFMNAEGEGRIRIKNIKFRYFINQGILLNSGGGTQGDIQIEDVECTNCPMGIEFQSPVVFLELQNVKCNNNTGSGAFIDDVLGFFQIIGNCEFNGNTGGNGVFVRHAAQVLIGDFDKTQKFNNNAGDGLAIISCDELSIQAIGFGGTFLLETKDNGGSGIVVKGVPRGFIEELAFGGTAKIVSVGNNGKGLLVEASNVQVDISATENATFGDQPVGSRAELGAVVKEVNNSITGTVDTEIDGGGSFV